MSGDVVPYVPKPPVNKGGANQRSKGLPHDEWKLRVQNKLRNSKTLKVLEQIAVGEIYEYATAGKTPDAINVTIKRKYAAPGEPPDRIICVSATKNTDRIAAARLLFQEAYRDEAKDGGQPPKPPATREARKAQIIALLPNIFRDLEVEDWDAAYRALGVPVEGESEPIEDAEVIDEQND